MKATGCPLRGKAREGAGLLPIPSRREADGSGTLSPGVTLSVDGPGPET